MITDALPQTLQVIQDRGVDVRLIEPLPAYEWNVPVVRAVSAMRKKSISIQTREQHLGKHQDYFTAADGGIGGSTISISERLCSPDCLISNVDGEGLYRDGHHLSVAGALWFRPEISELVERIVLSGERRDGPVSETGHAAGSQVTGDAVK